MPSDDAFARRSDRADLLPEADGFVVVSWWQDRSGDGHRGSYEYDHRPSLNDALEAYREYQDGEYARARAIGIFAARHGLPIAGGLEPTRLMRLMAELRRDG